MSTEHTVYAIRHRQSGYYQLASHDTRLPALWADREMALTERDSHMQPATFEIVELTLIEPDRVSENQARADAWQRAW